MQTVFEYIKTQENRYKTQRVPVVDGYEWNMFEHVQLTVLYLNSRYKTGNQDDIPFRQIILPKRNLAHRAMDFALKEIELFVNDSQKYHLSFLTRKYHNDVYAPENHIPEFLDKMTETYDDYGGVLLRDSPDQLEVIRFQQIAFCDQTDLLGGPMCLKHPMTPDELKKMEKYGWGDKSLGATHTIDEVIALVAKGEAAKANSQMGQGQEKTQTPGYYIEVYDLEGELPEHFLKDDVQEANKFIRQLQIGCFYYDEETKEKKGITLFKGKKQKSSYKAKKRDDEDASTYGRALGRGGVEELFEAQVWVNWNEMQKKELLEAAGKVLYQTLDQAFQGKNTSEYAQGEIVTGTQTLTQVNNYKPDAVVAFENAAQAWDQSAKEIAAAWDSMTGRESKSGTPFKLEALKNTEGHSLHRYRKSKLGHFLSYEVYPDWILPKIAKGITKGREFLSSLSLDEMNEVVESVARCQYNDKMKDAILEEGREIMPGEPEEMFEMYKQEFMRGGTKRFIKILEGELKDLPLKVQVNITGEQKDQLMMEKLSAVWTQATQILITYPTFFEEHPHMAKFFNEMIENSGLSPIQFGLKGTYTGQRQLNPQQNANAVPTPAPNGRQNVQV